MSNNTRILFVNSSLNSGGSEKVMTLIANELCERGYDVSMVLLRDKGADVYKLDSDIHLFRCEYKSKKKSIIAIERATQLRKAIKMIKPEIVISFMIDINIFVLLVTLGMKVPTIVSERADPNQIKGIIKKLEIPVYKLAKHVVFQTEYIQKQYPKFIRERSSVISNPVSPDIPDAIPCKHNEIVSAGRLSDQKNFSLLIEAFNEFRKKHDDYHLTIYGDGTNRNQLEDLIKELGIKNYVSLPGFTKDVDAKMNGASMFISSSIFEGISNAMLEALAMGIPTIATDCPVGGARQVIDNQVNGILIPVNDKKALIKAMESVIDNKELNSKIRNNSIKIKNDYSIKNIVNEWERLIIDVIGSK